MKNKFGKYIKNIIVLSLVIALVSVASGCTEIFSKYKDPDTGEFVAQAAEISLLKKTSIKTIFSSEENVFYIMNNGALLASGNNAYGLLGQGNKNEYDYVVQVKLPERIKNVTANSRMAVAVSDTNNVYIWGDLSWWGISDETAENGSMVWKQFSFSEIVSGISLSENHIAVLTKKGHAYTLGINNGQLGYDFNSIFYGNFYSTFRKVETEEFISAIETNNTTTYLLSSEGKLYGCSKNENSELGFIEKLSVVNEMDSNESFTAITTAGNNVFALADNGTVYACGSNKNGVLGINSSIAHTASLTSVKFADDVKVTSVQGNDTLGFVSFITEDKNVYTCGYNPDNSLYTVSKDEELKAPVLVDIGQVEKFFGTGATKFYIDTDYHLYTYGSNKYSQMPNIKSDKTDKTVPPTRIYANVK